MAYYAPHLYLICYPNSSLVLSQLEPADFIERYSHGSTSYHAGKMIFGEVNIDYRDPYFRIDEALERFSAHDDGSPKASKYISSYRVLEHVRCDAIEVLYLVNSDGSFYPLYPGTYDEGKDEGDLHLYAEISPLTMMTLSRFNMREFGRWFTGENKYLSVPRLLYLELGLDVDQFLADFERNPFITPPVQGVHPARLRNAIEELRGRPDKVVKGLTLEMPLTQQSYRLIKNGVMLMDQESERFFEMPPATVIENENLRFYRGM